MINTITGTQMIHALKTISCVAPMLAATVVGVGAIAPAAQAGNFVPQEEGEVDVGLGACLGTDCSYLDLGSLIESIESLEDSSTRTRSRLFVDKAGTDNVYGGIKFQSKDLGTAQLNSGENFGDYWFRPAAMKADSITPLLENGQLEVGTFKFTFSKVLNDLTVNWFDTEKADKTSYIVVDHEGNETSGIVMAGANNNIQSSTFTNVKTITLNLGERFGGTGDGVNFQGHATVPEPGLMMGLGAFAVAGGLGLRKRQTDDTAA